MSWSRLHYHDLLLVLAGVLLSTASRAQLSVAPASDLVQLAQSLAGAGVQVANPVLECHAQGHGNFIYLGPLLDTPAGVLLTTGSIDNALGPNDAENTSLEQFQPGSTLLTTMTGRTTFDACHLEFDLIPSGDTIRVDYGFASEEYPEWVGSQYNDVFGIFISGPGIVGDPGLGGERNLALVPNTTTPVMINTVNAGSNPIHFQDNTGGSQLQYDGLTKHLEAISVVQPCATYRMKFVIADVSDRLYDSGLFIAPISSNGVTMSVQTSAGLDYAVEGCNPGMVRFTRPTALPFPQPVYFYLDGTATNGSDFPLIGADADPSTLHAITIPASQSSVDLSFNILDDGVPEGPEVIRIILGSPSCPGVRLDSIELPVQDHLQLGVSAPAAICAGSSVALQADGAISYSWTPATSLDDAASPTPIAAPLVTTTYSVQGIAGGCVGTMTTTITVSNLSLGAVITPPLCHGQSNGIVNLSVTGGVPPYVHSWSGPNGFSHAGEDLVNIPAGTYTVTVSDATGCSRVQSFNVNSPGQLTASLAPSILPLGQNISCFGNDDGSIDLTLTGGVAPYNITWTGPNGFSSNVQDISGLQAGSYSVTVVDQNGCSSFGSMVMSQPPPLDPTITAFSNVTCFGAADGSATASITGGIPPYSFQWSTAPPQSGTQATGLAPGTHAVTVTDGYGCSASTTVTISQPPQLVASLTALGNVIHCQGQSQQHGTATAVANGGTPPYTYSWNTVPPQSAASAVFLSGGNYTVTITDANGCEAGAAFLVEQPGSPTTSILEQTNVSCFGENTGSATIDISGGGNVQSVTWNTTPAQSGYDVSGLPPGTWTATAIHANGCQTQVQVTITGPGEPLSASISGSGAVQSPSCSGGTDGSATVTVDGDGGPFTYEWNTVPTQHTPTATGLSAGSYTVTITDAFGCTTTATAQVDEPAPVIASIAAYTNVLCFETAQGTATANATGGTAPYSYMWDTTPSQNGATATDLAAGTHVVTVTDANGCQDTAHVTIGGPQFGISTFIEEVGNETCAGAADGYATVGATGGSNSYTFTWNTVTPVDGPTATGLAPGNYTVEVVDNNGCDVPKFLVVTILGPASPLEIATSVTDASCYSAGNGAIDLTISGGVPPYVHTWSDQDGNTTDIEDLTGMDPGTYFLHVHDAYGCIVDTSVTVQATNLLQAVINTVQIPCEAGTNGALAADVMDGQGPFDHLWSGPAGYSSNAPAITDLIEGTYTLVVTDANGCTATAASTLTGTPPPAIAWQVPSYPGGTSISCAGATDGSISLSINGGTGPFSITWTDGLGFTSNDPDLTGLAAGIYQVTVTDAHGCLVTDQVDLSAPMPISLNAILSNYNGANVSCASANDGQIDLLVSGGIAPYSFTWSNGATIEDLNDLGAVTASVIVQDVNGCQSTGSWTLTSPSTLGASITASVKPGGTGVSCDGASDGELLSVITGGTAPYTLAWTGPGGFTADTTHLQGLMAGTYHLQVTDANGCIMVEQAVLSAPAPVSITVSSTTYNGDHHIACPGNATGSITASATGGTPDHTFQWSGPAGFSAVGSTIAGLIAGTYLVTATDANGCVASTTMVLTEAPVLDAIITTSDAGYGYQVGCTANDGGLSAVISGGTPSYQFDWSGPLGFASMEQDLTGLVPGNYHLTITDANGCTFETNALLLAPSPIGVVLTTMASNCPDGGNGSITTSISGGVGPYSTVWSGPDGFTSTDPSPTGLSDGTYLLTISDAMGCASQSTSNLQSPAAIHSGAYVAQYGDFNLQCIGDSSGLIELAPSGGTPPYTITMGGPAGYLSGALVHQGLPAGSYPLSIVDAHGCSLDTLITLTEPTAGIDVSLTLSTFPSGTNVSCHGASDGWIQATVDGNGPFTFVWRGPDSLEYNTPNIQDLPAGNYSYELVVTDGNGCTFSTDVTLTQPDTSLYASALTSVYNGGHALSCSNSADGWIDLTVAGGNGGNTFSWVGPDGFTSLLEDPGGLTSGPYTVTIVDMNGCELQQTIPLDAPEPLINELSAMLHPGGTMISCHGADDAGIVANIGGGVPGLVPMWTGPNGPMGEGTSISDLGPGSYCLTLTDANGCVLESCLDVTEPEVLVVITTATDAPCGDASGSVVSTTTGGTAPYVHAWSTGANGTGPGPIPPGNYSVTVTDANGCQASSTATVQGSQPLAIDALVGDVTCYAGVDGTIDLQVDGGSAPLSISWDNGAATGSLSGLTPGTYGVVVTDANGCTASGNWQVLEPSPIVIDATPHTYPNGHNLSEWGSDDGRITTWVTGGTPGYLYAWSSGSSSPNIAGLAAGSYSLTVTDANGCTATINLELEQPSDLALPTGFSPNGDGANDLFIIRGLEAYPSNTFVVFNRWGNVVYDRLNYRNDWSGENTEGQPMPDGTYFVVLKVAEGTRSMQGYVDLRR